MATSSLSADTSYCVKHHDVGVKCNPDCELRQPIVILGEWSNNPPAEKTPEPAPPPVQPPKLKRSRKVKVDSDLHNMLASKAAEQDADLRCVFDGISTVAALAKHHRILSQRATRDQCDSLLSDLYDFTERLFCDARAFIDKHEPPFAKRQAPPQLVFHHTG